MQMLSFKIKSDVKYIIPCLNCSLRTFTHSVTHLCPRCQVSFASSW
jgi:rRNA maturation endonuclease Nob1